MYKTTRNVHKVLPVLIGVIVLLFTVARGDCAPGAGFKNDDELLDETRANVEKHLNDEWRPQPVVKEGDELLIADFNSGKRVNNIGGNFGAWKNNLTDFSQHCKESFDSANRRGDTGFAIKLDYDVDSKNTARNGFRMALKNTDGTKYDNLAFRVKGNPKAGYTTIFKVELKNAAKETGSYYVTNIADEWQEVVIPLAEFKSLTDLSKLTEFVIVFEDKVASNKKGIIYIDDVRLTKNK